MIKKNQRWTDEWEISWQDAQRLARELVERVAESGAKGLSLMNRCRDIILLGCESYRHASRSESFAHGVAVSLQERAARRARTTYELRNVCSRMMRALPELGQMRLRDISADVCRQVLDATFTSDQQFVKGRAVLHSVFACAMRHGWCSSNPVDAIPRPVLREAEVEPLPWPLLKRLLRTANSREHRCCMPALGLMLWAGVRPAELRRLSWEDIDWQEKVICLRPRHSKTGGCRHISLLPVLLAWLQQAGKLRAASGSICPPNWVRRWRALRLAAGISAWQQDVLRHTFASYHLKHWHDLPRLQEEMGHRSARLLRTRYLSMRGITAPHAKLFWTPGKLG